ncbi:MAG: hypothetical protein ABSC19_01575 [Syntrophorhabdales bacterium]|jgi:hypothetical protein
MGRNLFVSLTVIAAFFIFTPVFAQQGMERQFSGPPAGERSDHATEWLLQNHLALTASPEQAFVDDYIVVAGEAVPSRTAVSSGERRLTAERAATVIAYRELAEMLHGVSVAGDTLVKGASEQYDVVRTAVSGFIRGAEVIHKEYNEQEGVALVILKVGRKGPSGFGTVLYQKILGDPAVKREIIEERPAFRASRPAVPEAMYDGLIVDAVGQSFRPALINRILTVKGEMLYDPSKVSQKILVERGCGEYTNSVDKARAALESRGVRNALVVKASGTSGSTDLVVSDDDAVRIFSADQKGRFIAEAKVAFVLK